MTTRQSRIWRSSCRLRRTSWMSQLQNETSIQAISYPSPLVKQIGKLCEGIIAPGFSHARIRIQVQVSHVGCISSSIVRSVVTSWYSRVLLIRMKGSHNFCHKNGRHGLLPNQLLWRSRLQANNQQLLQSRQHQAQHPNLLNTNRKYRHQLRNPCQNLRLAQSLIRQKRKLQWN